MNDTLYQLIDTHTGRIIATYTYSQRNAARRRRDKLDLEYGAVRYVVKPIFQTQSASASEVQQ